MKLPFTQEQFFTVFEKYNTTIFPGQLTILILGLAALLMVHFKKSSIISKVEAFLGLLWIWIGAVYHITFFSSINKPAIIFGIAFILQGLLFLAHSFSKSALQFNFKPGIKNYAGYFFALFGLIIYPLIGFLGLGSFSHIISLGLPCPSVIFTFGFLLLANNRVPRYLLIIPILWTLVGTSAAINLGVIQDYMLIISAVTTLLLLPGKKLNRPK